MRQALGPGALGRPRGSGWRGRWEGGSGWGTHANPWLFHFNVWQNSLQIKKKKLHAKRRFSKSLPISYCQLHRTHRGKLSFESFPIMNSLQTRGRQFLSHSSHLGPVYLKLDNKHFTTITGYNPWGKAFHSNHLLSDSLTSFCAGGSNPLQGEHRQNWNMLLV